MDPNHTPVSVVSRAPIKKPGEASVVIKKKKLVFMMKHDDLY